MKTTLKAIANELNEVLGLEPAIATVGIKKADLEGKIKEAAELITADDEFTDDVKADLIELGFWPLKDAKKATKTAKPAKPAKAAKPAPVEEEEEEEEVEETEDDDEEEEEEEEEEVEEAPAKTAKTAKTAKEVKVKKEKQASPYGTAVDIMCTDPNMKLDVLTKKVVKAGFDATAAKGAIGTAYSSVRKIYGLLKFNGIAK